MSFIEFIITLCFTLFFEYILQLVNLPQPFVCSILCNDVNYKQNVCVFCNPPSNITIMVNAY